MSAQNRIIGIDIARGLAIILVVIGHWWPSDSPEGWNRLIEWIYTFHMPLFLFVSGYVFSHNPRPYKTNLKGKAKRLLIPYFTTSIIIITIKLLFPGNLKIDHPVTPYAYLEMFWKPAAGYFLWFIWVLWWCFCIVPVFKRRNSHLVIFLLCVLMAYIPGEFTDIFALNALKANMMWFVAGVVTYDFRKQFTIESTVTTIISSLIFTGLSVAYFIESDRSLIGLLLSYTGCIAPIGICGLMGRHLKGKAKGILLSLSASSYIIYLFHTTFEGLAKGIIYRFSPSAPFWLLSVAVIFIGTAGPWILNSEILIRWKITRFLFGLHTKKRHHEIQRK